MGCDIHAHIEVKKNDTWHHYYTGHVERNYCLFALMGGTRLNEVKEMTGQKIVPMATMKSLPDDATFVTTICYLQDTENFTPHSTGVIYACDLPELQSRLYALCPGEHVDLEWDVFHVYVNGNSLADHQGWDDLRIIFWFDN